MIPKSYVWVLSILCAWFFFSGLLRLEGWWQCKPAFTILEDPVLIFAMLFFKDAAELFWSWEAPQNLILWKPRRTFLLSFWHGTRFVQFSPQIHLYLVYVNKTRTLEFLLWTFCFLIDFTQLLGKYIHYFKILYKFKFKESC